MICDDAAEYVSALCDSETIPAAPARHIAACPDCQSRLRDYLAMGVELRRTASLALAESVTSRTWTKRQSRVATWWQKGWQTMRIPRLAFGILIACVVVLSSFLVANKARANDTGTVVLLTMSGPEGRTADCPLSTVDKKWTTCAWFGDVSSQGVAYKVTLLSREGEKVLLGVRTRTYPSAPGPRAFSYSDFDSQPERKIWFEPGQSLKVDVPGHGTLTLSGVWMDHVPVLGKLDPGADEIRLASPLLLKDNVVAGDDQGASTSANGSHGQGEAIAFYIPREGRFLISQLPMKGAVEAHVGPLRSRVAFKEGGHSWELVSGEPVCRAGHLWVLRQPGFKMKIAGAYHSTLGNMKLDQTGTGIWEPQD